jgi:hypothetical protein
VKKILKNLLRFQSFCLPDMSTSPELVIAKLVTGPLWWSMRPLTSPLEMCATMTVLSSPLLATSAEVAATLKTGAMCSLCNEKKQFPRRQSIQILSCFLPGMF